LLICISMAQTGAAAQAADSKENSFSSTLSGGINLRSIAGAPFSADVVKESIKMLPDGSDVPVVTRGKMFRDAEGRIRSEMELLSASATARRYVTIVDPVAQVSMVLDPQSKTATITPLPQPQAARRVTRQDADRISAKSLAIPGTQDLGASMLQGFSVTGSRTTRPAQKAGNTVAETWFSPELKIELQAKIEAPDGSTTTRLENIVTAEPDRALFEPPADYTVKTISPSK
ncbi:MAG TPA: hypothetical protein VGJ51_13430, partial [Candidatus Angelobacter sp.]